MSVHQSVHPHSISGWLLLCTVFIGLLWNLVNNETMRWLQHILFWSYGTPKLAITDLIHFFKIFQTPLCFWHPIALKHSGQLDYEVMQRVLFRGYSTPNFDKTYSSLKIIQAWFHFQLTPTAFIWSGCYLLDREKKTERRWGEMHITYRTTLVLCLVWVPSVFASHFRVCTMSYEPVVWFLPYFYGYIIRTK